MATTMFFEETVQGKNLNAPAMEIEVGRSSYVAKAVGRRVACLSDGRVVRSSGECRLVVLSIKGHHNLMKMDQSRSMMRISGHVLWLAIFGLGIIKPATAAWKETVLYSFQASGSYEDGYAPGQIIFDKDGNIYGNTAGGGPSGGNGTVFELTPSSAGLPWAKSVIHSFVSTPTDQDGSNAAFTDLVFDASGNLYGTTVYGGVGGYGTVFQLSPPRSGQTTWSESIIASFNGNALGGNPAGRVVFDQAGNLFGSNSLPGKLANGGGDSGSVFKLEPPQGEITTWTVRLARPFKTIAGGSQPFGGVVIDSAGNLFGTTYEAANGQGLIFKLAPPGTGETVWTESVIHVFKGGSDGSVPSGRLTFDKSGNLFGSTVQGGSTANCGTIFELVRPPTGKTVWKENVLHVFNCHDGNGPNAGLVFDKRGNIYGTTRAGTKTNAGMVFQLVPPAAGRTVWAERILYSFTGGNDGKGPGAGVIFDSHGNLFGSTYNGGPAGIGTIFELSP